MNTKAETAAQLETAHLILDRLRDHFRDGGILFVSQELGTGQTDYLKVFAVIPGPGMQIVSNLTWAIAQVFGYKLRDRSGYWHLAINGGNFSKPGEVARLLQNYYGLSDLNHATI